LTWSLHSLVELEQGAVVLLPIRCGSVGFSAFEAEDMACFQVFRSVNMPRLTLSVA
jgi:hypothetical protein